MSKKDKFVIYQAKSSVFIERPSLAYHRAFDLCAMKAAPASKSVALFASSLFYARELTRRLSGEVLLHPTSNWQLEESEIYHSTQPSHLPLSAIIWAEPEVQTWPDMLNQIHQLAVPGTRLCILGTTKLRRILPEWAGHSPAHKPLHSPRRLAKAVRKLGYVIEDIYGLHGPLSLLFGTASRIPALLGREELVDRCHIAMRQRFIVRGWQASFAPVWLLVARNESISNPDSSKE